MMMVEVAAMVAAMVVKMMITIKPSHDYIDDNHGDRG